MRKRRWLDLLLRLHPRDFREAHGAEVEEFVDAELEAAGPARPWVAVRLFVDLLATAIRLKIRSGRAGGTMGVALEREGWTMSVGHDLKQAVRGLLRSPGFTAVVVATLALGVGLTTALFSVVNGVLLRGLEYEEPERLVYLMGSFRADGVEDALFSGGDLKDLRGGVDALESLEGVASIRQNLNGAGLPRQVDVGWISPSFLSMLGVDPLLGRLPAPDDPPGTAVLSHGLWVNAFGSSSDVLGRTVRLDGHPHTVVGVMPRDFRLRLPPRGGRVVQPQIWKNPDQFWQNGDVWNNQGPELGLLRLVGRLAPGASRADAQAEVEAVVADMGERFPGYAERGMEVAVQDLHARVVRDVRPTLMLLLGAVGLVLLIACANVANLMLVRARARRREMAMHMALGCPGGRVGRFLFLESLVLALLGALGGLVLAASVLGVVPALAPPEIPMVDAVAVDGRVLAFALAAALFTTVTVGVAPAWRTMRTDPARELGNGRSGGLGGGRVQAGLVVSQVALSLMLLVGAGLLTSTLVRLHDVEPGFEPEGLYTFRVSIPGARYGWPEEADRFYRAVEERVAALPGVESAGVVWPMPFSGTWSGDHEVAEGEPRPLGLVPYKLATEDWFPTAGIPVLEGRLFREDDDRHSLVVSESVARRAWPGWPGRPAVGRTLRANPWGRGLEEYQVIGVVGDVRDADLRTDPAGALYFDTRGWSWVDWEVHVVARTTAPGSTLLPGIREAVAELDAEVPVARPGSMAEALRRQTASTRFVLAVLGIFAGAAVLLALVGLYGVVSYSVGLRAREFGVRLALGAARGGIQTMVLRRAVRLALGGVALGLAGALVLGRLLETLLFGVTPGDPLTLVGVALLLTAAAAAAAWIPARRASRMDPVEILKAQ